MKMHKPARILRIVMLTCISLLLGTMLYRWNAETLVGNKLPMPFGCGFSVVLSGSMEPVLHVNDFVMIRKQESYQPDDIVVYQDGSSLVIHRLLRISADAACTKGDANNIEDPEIKPDRIKGKMILRIPMLGAVVRFIKSPVGTVLMLLAAVFLFEMPYLKQKKQVLAEQEKIKEEIRRLRNE